MIYINQLIEFIYRNPDVSKIFIKSDMTLKLHSNGSYLSVRKYRSRSRRNFYFRDNFDNTTIDPCQVSIDKEHSVIKPIIRSAAET